MIINYVEIRPPMNDYDETYYVREYILGAAMETSLIEGIDPNEATPCIVSFSEGKKGIADLLRCDHICQNTHPDYSIAVSALPELLELVQKMKTIKTDTGDNRETINTFFGLTVGDIDPLYIKVKNSLLSTGHFPEDNVKYDGYLNKCSICGLHPGYDYYYKNKNLPSCEEYRMQQALE